VAEANGKRGLIRVSLPGQDLRLLRNGRTVFACPVSTAANGAGERMGSQRTPRGCHVVRARIGANEPCNAVFVARRPTGEIYTSALGRRYPERDWILTRILWLSGTEPGRNRLGEVDTMRRFIYIHGCPDSVALGKPGSHGCIRLANRHVSALFDLAEAGTPVLIEA